MAASWLPARTTRPTITASSWCSVARRSSARRSRRSVRQRSSSALRPPNAVRSRSIASLTITSHHPDPTVAENLVQLQQAVKDNRCDLGIGFDGDGDRIGVIDAQGRILWGDQLLIVLARDVLKHHRGAPVLADVKASQVLFDEIDEAGGKPV